jgi:3-phytase
MRRVECVGTLLLAAVAAGCSSEPPPEPFEPVTSHWARPTVETPPVADSDDAADDPAVWVDPDDPARSLILGTNKDAGLHVYDLAGRELQYLPAGRVNNVDLRVRPWGERDLTVAVASHREPSELVVFTLDHPSRSVREARRVPVDLTEPYGVCMYQDTDGQPWVFLNDKDGTYVQYRLERDYTVTEVRRFATATQPEGCVAHDVTATLYVGEEMYGIWRTSADPGGDGRLIPFAAVADGHMTADVEGLTVYDGGSGRYLIASSQGDNSFAVFDADSADYLGSFHIGRHPELDDVSETDGLDVTAVSLPGFPDGLLVVQDGYNDRPRANQNFKLVPWREVAPLLEPAASDAIE